MSAVNEIAPLFTWYFTARCETLAIEAAASCLLTITVRSKGKAAVLRSALLWRLSGQGVPFTRSQPQNVNPSGDQALLSRAQETAFLLGSQAAAALRALGRGGFQPPGVDLES